MGSKSSGRSVMATSEIFVLPDVELVITIFAGNYNDFRHSVGERIIGQILGALR